MIIHATIYTHSISSQNLWLYVDFCKIFSIPLCNFDSFAWSLTIDIRIERILWSLQIVFWSLSILKAFSTWHVSTSTLWYLPCSLSSSLHHYMDMLIYCPYVEFVSIVVISAVNQPACLYLKISILFIHFNRTEYCLNATLASNKSFIFNIIVT